MKIAKKNKVSNLAPIAAVMLLKRWLLCVCKRHLSGKRDVNIYTA